MVPSSGPRRPIGTWLPDEGLDDERETFGGRQCGAHHHERCKLAVGDPIRLGEADFVEQSSAVVAGLDHRSVVAEPRRRAV